MTHVKVFIDGAARNNPGPAGIGISIEKDGKPFKEYHGYLGETTNNIAEYSALLTALEHLVKLKIHSADFFSDSELLVKQINGQYRVKNEVLIQFHAKATALIRKMKHFSIAHVRREQNKRADELANMGIDQK